MKDNPLNTAAGGNGTDNMPKFVNGHHRQPAQRQEGADQQNLVEAIHKGSRTIRHRSGMPR